MTADCRGVYNDDVVERQEHKTMDVACPAWWSSFVSLLEGDILETDWRHWVYCRFVLSRLVPWQTLAHGCCLLSGVLLP